MPKFSRKGLNSRKLELLEHCNDLFPIECLIWANVLELSFVDLNRAIVWSNGELIQYSREKFDCFGCWLELIFPFDRWLELLFLQNFVWFMIVDLFPCKWLNFDRTMNWISIPANIVWMSIDEMIQCLNYGWWLELIFSFWSVVWTFLLFDLWLSTWTVISVQLFDRWFCSIVPAKLLNRYSWVIVWILIDELNQYSREIVDLYRYSWANVWIFYRWFDPIFPWNCWLERTFEFSSMNLKRMFEFWSIIELIQYSRDNFGLIWLLTWTVIPERTFYPVILRHLFDFVTVGSPRMCFRISFVTVFVLNFPCISTVTFVAEFELFTSETLPSLLGEVVEFELCASEVVTSYMIPTCLRGGI